MSESESKHEQLLKRAQLWIAVLVGVVTLAVGLYNAKNLFLTKKGPGGVTVAVRAANNGQPVPRATVELSTLQGGVVASAETGADGAYGRQGLDPGSYTLKVAKAGFDPATLVVTVEPAHTAELTVRLAASSSQIGSAVEEVGASWIKKLGTPQSSSDHKTPK